MFGITREDRHHQPPSTGSQVGLSTGPSPLTPTAAQKSGEPHPRAPTSSKTAVRLPTIIVSVPPSSPKANDARSSRAPLAVAWSLGSPTRAVATSPDAIESAATRPVANTSTTARLYASGPGVPAILAGSPTRK